MQNSTWRLAVVCAHGNSRVSAVRARGIFVVKKDNGKAACKEVCQHLTFISFLDSFIRRMNMGSGCSVDYYLISERIWRQSCCLSCARDVYKVDLREGGHSRSTEERDKRRVFCMF